MSDAPKLRWGILGPGTIARTFAAGVAHSATGTLVAIGARDPDRPGYAEQFPGARVLAGYDALLADPEVEAVYIATPHPQHAEWAIKAAEAGKHLLVEKPMGLSAYEADAIFHAARRAGTFAGEGFMYRMHPQTVRLLELIRDGAIGEVRMIQSSFGFMMPKFDPAHRLYSNDLAGGGILDVGCYPVSMARLIAGAVDGKPFLEPSKVAGMARLGESGVDEWAAAILQFPNDILAEVACAVSLKQENVLRVLGTAGRIEVADFWFASGREGGVGKIAIVAPDGGRRTVEVDEPRLLYAFEVDAAAAAIRAGAQEFAPPGMTWDDTLGNLRVLDKWRADAGLKYGIERPEARPRTLRNAPLAAPGTTIPHKPVKALPKSASRLALGFEDFPDFASASILLDAFWEKGGNVFDTGWVYGMGRAERVLGEWMRARGTRDGAVVIGKGAHSPLTYPDVIARQLGETLDRLGTDYLDVYFMHRDNPAVPVAEFVDAMDAEVKAGRIRGPIGGSNWTRQRLDAAIDYARKNGKTELAAFSNNFSLAEMNDPVWAGCIHASDAAWKAWATDRQLTNFAWSSQGRGFFTDAAGRDKRDNPELVRVWYSDANFARRDRAVQLAEKLGKRPIHVALAYTLAQPFPVLPLIGPRRLVELDDSLEALTITLTPEEVLWLDTGETVPA
jgi:predicted dehydrogenase/aryl-alcohol dehydrogenase-like predicted oxidoreductase